MQHRLTVAAFVFAAGIAWVIYAPGLGGPLLLDDVSVIRPLMDAAARGELESHSMSSRTGPLGRPLAMTSFALNASFHGSAVAAWKATNVGLHALTGFALYALFAALARACGVAAPAARTAAAACALLWLVHPLHVSTVLYTVQRMTQFATLFSVLGMLSYVSGRTAPSGQVRGALLIASAFAVFTPLAALSKETGLMLPVYLVALELTVFAHTPRPRWLVAVFAVGAVLPAVAGLAYLATHFQARVLATYGMRDFTLAERLMTQPRVLLTYLQWILVPRRRDMGFYHDDVEVTRSLAADPIAVLGAFVALAALAGAWWLRARLPLVAFGVVLFLAAHGPESSVFGLELAFEHRNYLPSAGILIALTGLALASRYARLFAVAGFVFAGALALGTSERARVWGQEARLYASFVDARPHSVRARVTLAEWLLGRRDFDGAMAALDGMSHLTLDVHRLRVLCERNGTAGPAAEAVLAAVVQSPVASHFEADVLAGLARLAADGRCALPETALADALEVAAAHRLPAGRRHRAFVYGAMLRQRAGRLAEAFALLSQAAALQPDDPFAWYLGAEWAADAGDAVTARAMLASARASAARSARDHGGMDAAVAEMIDAL